MKTKKNQILLLCFRNLLPMYLVFLVCWRLKAGDISLHFSLHLHAVFDATNLQLAETFRI